MSNEYSTNYQRIPDLYEIMIEIIEINFTITEKAGGLTL